MVNTFFRHCPLKRETENGLAILPSLIIIERPGGVFHPQESITKIGVREHKEGRFSQGGTGKNTGTSARKPASAASTRSKIWAGFFEEAIRRLRSCIGEIAGVLYSIAGGDLTNGARQDCVGDFASIRESPDSILIRLDDAMHQIRHSAEQAASSSEQASISARTLSQDAAEQAGSAASPKMPGAPPSPPREAGQFLEQAGAQPEISREHVKNLNHAMEQFSGVVRNNSAAGRPGAALPAWPAPAASFRLKQDAGMKGAF